MRPTLPLSDPTIHDILDSVNTQLTQAGYCEKITLVDDSTLYTYDNETLILVDTSVARTIRLPQTAGYKHRVAIVDAMGTGANVNPISIIAYDSVGMPEIAGGVITIKDLRGGVDLVSDGSRWFIATAGGTYPNGRVFPAMLLFPENLDYPLTIAADKTGLAMDYTLSGPGSLTISPGGILVQA